ncbi:hypothetical protein RB195_002901 [Necator americanus]|uniref:Uncharacterized protein n=1 Tax=Necator americanus TaxID=51031 RepID=A0ABR1DLW1_NECAM
MNQRLQWNEQERHSEFIMTTETTDANSEFQKLLPVCWLWESLGGRICFETDQIIIIQSKREISFTWTEEKAAKDRGQSLRTIIRKIPQKTSSTWNTIGSVNTYEAVRESQKQKEIHDKRGLEKERRAEVFPSVP